MGCNEVCVVHLVRACNGIEPLKRFLTSYTQHPAGMKHDSDSHFFMECCDGNASIMVAMLTILTSRELFHKVLVR
jgi:hypothetical protein